MTAQHTKQDMERIKAEAREWLLQQKLDGAERAAQDEFGRWLQADPRHGDVYALAEQAWNDLSNMGADPDVAAMKELPQSFADKLFSPLRGLAPRPVWAFAVVALMAVGFAMVPMWQEQALIEETYQTEVAELREVMLPDGSQVTLGGKTNLAISFSAEERRVQLTSGEAFFSVEKAVDRPFVVVADGAEVRVLGTSFGVRTGGGQLRVAVEDGLVEVSAGEEAAEKQLLKAGQMLTADNMLRVRNIAAETAGAWRKGRLVYNEASLAALVADANRYFAGEIRLASADMAAMQVNTSFRSDQVEQMIKTLEYALPITVEYKDNQVILLAKKS